MCFTEMTFQNQMKMFYILATTNLQVYRELLIQCVCNDENNPSILNVLIKKNQCGDPVLYTIYLSIYIYTYILFEYIVLYIHI